MTGLTGTGLVLTLNGGHDLAVSGSSFMFGSPLASGSSYVISIDTQPTGQTCSLDHAISTVTDTDITDVRVDCTDAQAKLTLTIDDGQAFARYGQTLDYLVTLNNSGNATASGVVVVGSMSAGLDSAHAHWKCIGASGAATCTTIGVGPLGDTVTLPVNRSLTWIVTVPVKVGATDDTVEMNEQATDGATSVSDQDTLVIFRDGTDVAHADGTKAVIPAPGSAAILSSDGSDTFRLPPPSSDDIDTVRTLRNGDTVIRIQRLTLGQATWVRLLQHPHSGEERASAWMTVAADANLSTGSVAGKRGQRIILLEGARHALSLPVTH